MNTVISTENFRTQVMKRIDDILKETKKESTRMKLINLKKFFWVHQE